MCLTSPGLYTHSTAYSGKQIRIDWISALLAPCAGNAAVNIGFPTHISNITKSIHISQEFLCINIINEDIEVRTKGQTFCRLLFQMHLKKKKLIFLFIFYGSSFLWLQLTKNEHWFGSWVDAEQATSHDINGLVQERRNSIANALELRLSCTNQLIWTNNNPVWKMHACVPRPQCVNSSPPTKNGCHFADDSFSCIFMNESFVFW